MSTVGDRLKMLRKRVKISQQELSNRLGLNRATYARYETGDTQADYETLQKLADFFEVSVDYLLGRTDDPSLTDKTIEEEIDDPELGLWFKELKEAPEERRRELKQIWEIIKQREAGRKPGDKQGE